MATDTMSETIDEAVDHPLRTMLSDVDGLSRRAVALRGSVREGLHA